MSGRDSLKDASMEEVYEVARALMRKGAQNHEVESQLVYRGISQQAAASVVKNVIKMRGDTRGGAGAGVKNMVAGGALCIIGILITTVSYMAAAGGGTYVITWGAIVFGGVLFVRGLTDYLAR